MKATGIVRNVDVLGRIVIPKELRDLLNIDIKDPIEFYADDNYIYLKKYNPACVFCNIADGLIRYKGKYICKRCMDGIIK